MLVKIIEETPLIGFLYVPNAIRNTIKRYKSISANNYILIKEIVEKDSPLESVFTVNEKDDDTLQVLEHIITTPDLREAIMKAEEFIVNSEYGVEYGIRFVLE